jgi:murein L,D-transpeptidase YcbB/YkuD
VLTSVARSARSAVAIAIVAMVAIAAAALAEGQANGLATQAERDVDALYSGRAVGTLWLDASQRPTSDARAAVAMLAGAFSDGLDPTEYAAADLAARLDSLAAAPVASPTEAAALDRALSSAVVRYLRDLHFGRVDPRTVGFSLAPTAEGHDIAGVILEALAAHQLEAAARALRPPLAQYGRLREALARYRALDARPDLAAPPPASAKSVHPGDPYAGVGLLAARLRALGDLDDPWYAPVDDRYDGALVEAVRRFQARHGLAEDGVLGRATLAALAVPFGRRARQIALSLERLRWLPDLTGPRLIAINIPMFRLWGWSALPQDPVPAIEMNVIVGRALNTQTPIFTASLEEVIFRPFWNVPRSIVRGEILPKIAADPDYFDRQRLQIVRGETDHSPIVPPTPENLELLRSGAARLRQMQGPANSLGRVKFNFPNTAAVYLHDTPSRTLFGRPRRDFSHGCVRVEDPEALAEWVLDDRETWPRDRILAAMDAESGPPQRVRLRAPIPVVLLYLTAVVTSPSDAVRFADDVYRHDARLERALAARRPR